MMFLSDPISEPCAFTSSLCVWAVFFVCKVCCKDLILDPALITTQACREDNR